jgi:hypothetical protein
VRHKVARARKHLVNLNAETAAFLKPGGDDERPHGVAFTRELRQGILVVRASFIAERAAPVCLSLIAGDLANNLRAALDHFVAGLKRASGATNRQLRDGGFPVTYHSNEFRERAGRLLSGIPEDSDAWRAIEAAQPFQAEHPDAHTLAVLARLNNADKHRLLHPAFAYPSVSDGLELVDVLDHRHLTRQTARWKAGAPLQHGTEIAVLRFAPGCSERPVAANQGPVLEVSWGELSDTRTTFDAMIAAVEEIVSQGPDLATKLRT